MPNSSLVYIGIHGTVLALDRATGQQVWATKLKGDFINVAVADGDVYATGHGEVNCLDPMTGQVRWTNPLKGYGFGLISIACGNAGQNVLLRRKELEEQADANSTGA